MHTNSAGPVDLCPWLCRAPQEPGTPFAWPVFTIVDTFRILIALGCCILVAISLWAIRRSTTQGQMARFGMAFCLCLGAGTTEIEQIGMWPHYRFVIYLAGVTLGLWGYWRHLFREIPARDKPTGQDSSL
jgi:hypothetical protein